MQCSLIDDFVRNILSLNYFLLQLVDSIHLQETNVLWVLHSVENLPNSVLVQSGSLPEIRILISLRVYLLDDSELVTLLPIRLILFVLLKAFHVKELMPFDNRHIHFIFISGPVMAHLPLQLFDVRLRWRQLVQFLNLIIVAVLFACESWVVLY
jgi:hypothetical protein